MTNAESNVETSEHRLSFQPGGAPARDVIVSIFLRGGIDAFTATPPFGDQNLMAQRGELSVPEPGGASATADLDGFYGLHAALRPLEDLYRGGRLAVIQAVGSMFETTSHFDASKVIERGAPDPNSLNSGWLGRHLTSQKSANRSPLRAIAMSEMIPAQLEGCQALALPDVSEYRLNISDRWSPKFLGSLQRMYQRADARTASAAGDIFRMLRQLADVEARERTTTGRIKYPDTPLGKNLKQVAQLIKADVGLEAAAIDHFGWDTHLQQMRSMLPNMASLGGSLRAFNDDLGERMNGVTVVVNSEFGRRVKPNVNLGTDHGRAGAMFVLGGGIVGGKCYGKWPGSKHDDMDRSGCVRVTTDYRHILAELVDRRLGSQHLDEVFPGFKPEYLGIAKA